MRILEVGVGSAGTTAAVLETLSAKSTFRRFAEYVLTDSAGWYLSDARGRFSDCGGLVFQTMDILKDPVSQGFEEYSFDLIIAAGCLVELDDPASGLEHLHTLLKPGGSLVLVETTRSVLTLEILCRTLTGRWQQGELFKTATEWNDVLERCGFSGIIVSLQDVSTSPSPVAPIGSCPPYSHSVYIPALDSSWSFSTNENKLKSMPRIKAHQQSSSREPMDSRLPYVQHSHHQTSISSSEIITLLCL